jgi:hypothetical protein
MGECVNFMDYDELTQKASEYKQAEREKRKEGYQYARSLGFTSEEAIFLARKSKEEIDRIATERDNGNKRGG